MYTSSVYRLVSSPWFEPILAATIEIHPDRQTGTPKTEMAGVEPLLWDHALGEAAQLHAEDMRDNEYFSHSSQDGRSFVDRIRQAGYDGSPRAENIALGQQTPEQVMSSWMNSSGHRANILSGGSGEIGIGRADGYWVQVFGAP